MCEIAFKKAYASRDFLNQKYSSLLIGAKVPHEKKRRIRGAGNKIINKRGII